MTNNSQLRQPINDGKEAFNNSRKPDFNLNTRQSNQALGNLSYKFEIDVYEQRRINSRVQQMDLASRRAFEKGRFEVLKKEKDGLSDGEGGFSFYVISPDWF